jgi:glycerol-3-phosphate dehydrogenase
LCEQASRYFAHGITPADVVWTYSGVRPLLGDETHDASAVTRDYHLEFDTHAAPLLTVFGGKITTFRRLAEDAADGLCHHLGLKHAAWTKQAFLPGGDLSDWIGAPVRPDSDFERFDQALAQRHPQWPATVRRRLAHCYGSRINLVVGTEGLGEEVAPGLFEAELNYLHTHEWARSAEDVLWRRTKLGLHLSADERKRVAHWCESRWKAVSSTG